MAHHLIRNCVRAALALTAGFLSGCRPHQDVDLDRVYFDARSTLHQAAEDPDPHVRTKALEALAETEGRNAGAVMMQALQDRSGPVRFAAAMAVGDARYEPAKPLLLEVAKDTRTPPKLLCAVIYALHRMGDYSYTSQLGRLLHHENKWVRATVAMVMGRLGEPSAIGPLDTLRRQDHDEVVQLQVVEALAALGNQRAVALLRAFTKSMYLEDQIIAVQGLGRTDNPGSVYLLRKLLNDRKQHAAVRAAAAGSLARLGRPAGYRFALRAATGPEKLLGSTRSTRSTSGGRADVRSVELTSLQTLGVLALGRIGNRDAIPALQPLVFSRDGAVRVAACKAILQLLKGYRPARARQPAPRARRPVPEPPVRPGPTPPVAPGPPATQPAAPPSLPATQPARQPTTQPTTQAAVIFLPSGRTIPLNPPARQPAAQPAEEPTTQPATGPIIIYFPNGRTEPVKPADEAE